MAENAARIAADWRYNREVCRLLNLKLNLPCASRLPCADVAPSQDARAGILPEDVIAG